MTKSSIAVIVLNWNDADLLPKSVGSLLQQSEKCDVIVVDNGSEDNSRAVIESFGGKVTALWNKKNNGFAGGVNTGIRYALAQDYKYIALLNNDAVADKDWVRHLLAGFTDKSIGGATCSFIHQDKKHYDSTGNMYTTWGLTYPRGRGEPVNHQYDTDNSVAAITGGASIFRRHFFQDVGLFDEDFFAYYEDVDLGLRGQLRGWKFKFIPQAKAYHATGTTSGRVRGFATYQQLKNLPWLIVKNVPLQLLPRMIPRFTLAYWTIIFGTVTRGIFAPVIKGVVVSALYTPKKLVQRFAIQKYRKISPHDFYRFLTPDLPPSSPKLRKLRDAIRKKHR